MRVDGITHNIQTNAQLHVSVEKNSTPLLEIKNPIANSMTTVGELALIKAIDKASKALDPQYTILQYSRHEGTGTMMLKVLNRDTQEVIREIPPERILDIVAAIWDMAGIMVDKKI